MTFYIYGKIYGQHLRHNFSSPSSISLSPFDKYGNRVWSRVWVHWQNPRSIECDQTRRGDANFPKPGDGHHLIYQHRINLFWFGYFNNQQAIRLDWYMKMLLCMGRYSRHTIHIYLLIIHIHMQGQGLSSFWFNLWLNYNKKNDVISAKKTLAVNSSVTCQIGVTTYFESSNRKMTILELVNW